MIKRFDENIQLRALKSDLSEIIQSFKLYVKERVYVKGVTEIKELIQNSNTQLAELNQNLTDTGANCREAIKRQIKDVEKKLDQRMNEKLSNVPGYEPPSVS